VLLTRAPRTASPCSTTTPAYARARTCAGHLGPRRRSKRQEGRWAPSLGAYDHGQHMLNELTLNEPTSSSTPYAHDWFSHAANQMQHRAASSAQPNPRAPPRAGGTQTLASPTSRRHTDREGRGGTYYGIPTPLSITITLACGTDPREPESHLRAPAYSGPLCLLLPERSAQPPFGAPRRRLPVRLAGRVCYPDETNASNLSRARLMDESADQVCRWSPFPVPCGGLRAAPLVPCARRRMCLQARAATATAAVAPTGETVTRAGCDSRQVKQAKLQISDGRHAKR
jgi:hypothetical protein